MDDFEYSVQISDQDWDCFFQECEGCNLLSPGLASREDSGMSDIDEMGCHFLNRTPAKGTASTEPDPDLQIDEPADSEGSPVGNYLSKYGIRSPEQVLSGSEEDLHLQTVNLFFEQLKSVTENQQPLEQSHVVNQGSEETGHLVGLIDKQEILCVAAGPSGRNKASLIGDMSKQGVVNTWGDKASEKAVKPRYTTAQEDASKSDSELVIARKSLTAPLITLRMKQEQQRRFCNPGKNLELKPETKPTDKEKVVVVNRRDMTNPFPARQNFAYLDTISSSDSKDSPICQIPVSPSRRKKRKKKRMSVEPLELGCESQIHIRQSESEDDGFIQREEMNNLPVNVWKTEHFKSLIKTPNTDHLQLRNIPELEASDFQYSKSLPVSFTNNLGTTPPKPEVEHTCFSSVTKCEHDVCFVNNGQLKAEISGLSLLPQIEKIMNLQESTLNTPESFQFDPAVHLKESMTGVRETLSAPLSDNSDAGCQRKSLLSPNISSTADSTEPLPSAVSFKLPANKDLPCLGIETDCSAFKNDETMLSERDMVEISETNENSLSSVESCLDGYNTKPCVYTQEAPQNQNECPLVNISKSQSQPANQNGEINMNTPEIETNAMTESHIPHNIDHETDDILSGKKTTSEVIVNGSAIISGNLDESGDKQMDVSAKSDDEQLFCGKSSEDTSGPMNEDPTQELKSEANDAEIVSFDTSGHLPSPVFAISSFWNEMEKLTINDILRLRVTGNSQHTSILTQTDDGSIVDATDAADSGYFTQLDDSKPERLSGDMSYISDLDEDLAQLSSKQEDELCESPSSSGVMWENEPDPVIVGDEIIHISSETALSEHLYTANAQQCFRRMCKNMSVQNLQALDAQPIRKIRRNASMHSMYSEVEDDPFYHVNTSGSKIFSDDEEEVETSGVTFSEIIQYFFGEDEPERCASRAESIAGSYLDGTETSLPETYDHFFSEFDSGSFIYPFVEESGRDKMVPIFSCSRSANRNLQFPEAYDYFFPDSPGSSDEDDENDNTATKVVTQYDDKSPNHDPVDMYEHFYSEDESDYFWTSPLSLTRVRRTSFSIPEEKACSGELVPVKRFPKGIIQPINAFGPDGSPFPESFLLNLDSRIFQQLTEQQKKCMEIQTVVADPRLDTPFLPLKQADMCLVCIAFASWVLKSTGSGGDTWKAALLANISALSAIRYLRRHKREDVSGKTPLRQIEPA